MSESTPASPPPRTPIPAAPSKRRTPAATTVAYLTMLAWNALLFAAWMSWTIVDTRQNPDWGDLVALVNIFLGLIGLGISSALGAIAVAVMRRQGRWWEREISTGEAVRYGSIATAIGLSPILALLGFSLLTA